MGRVFRTRQPLQHTDERAGANEHAPLDAIVRFSHHLLTYRNIIDAKQTPITPSPIPRPTLAPALRSRWPTVHGSCTDVLGVTVNDGLYAGVELALADDFGDMLDTGSLLRSEGVLWLTLAIGVAIRTVVDGVALDWLLVVRAVDDEVVEDGWIVSREDCVAIVADVLGDRREVLSGSLGSF